MEISYIGLSVDYCRRFGQVAVERGLITPEHLLEALIEQVEDDLAGKRHRVLGDILVEKGRLTLAQVDTVLIESLGYQPTARQGNR